ncbi:L-xylulose reductase-like isoform X1 [Anneissia japonica]|uniref:L-xylulose reductase-like isoform X1 n=1 Tax=Anneissia japonica TaxID=1529436 RepID=UPI00142599D3|nr:L-xylulose reductase-like isoform X1 [Anneissia japonica]
MDIRFDGKKALVTGAGKGIGRDTVKLLAKCGADVYALSRTQSDLDSLKAEVPEIKTVCVDLSDWDSTKVAVEGCGPIDLLVNNAAIAKLEPFLEVTKEFYSYYLNNYFVNRTMNVNVRQLIQVSQIVARGMVERGLGGSIVNVSSQASLVGLTNHTVYCATKAAVDSLTKTMALELGPKNIRVNSVNPTVVNTAMGKIGWSKPEKAEPMKRRIPLGRFAEVEEVVHVILFLLSDKSSMMNGTCLPIDGGMSSTGV